MLNANAKDSARIELRTEEILKAAINANETQVFVNMREFYASCHLSKLPRNRFEAEVSDILTGTHFVNRVGTWVFAEYGDGLHVFCELHRAKSMYVHKFNLQKTLTTRPGDNVVALNMVPSLPQVAARPFNYYRVVLNVPSANARCAAHVLASNEDRAIEMTKERLQKAVTEMVTGRNKPVHQMADEQRLFPAHFWNEKVTTGVSVKEDEEILNFDFDVITRDQPFNIG